MRRQAKGLFFSLKMAAANPMGVLDQGDKVLPNRLQESGCQVPTGGRAGESCVVFP